MDYLTHPSKFHLLHEISTVLDDQKFLKTSQIFKKIYESKISDNSEKL